MDESLNTALVLMVVGMITVFVILGLVVLTGKLLIRLVNKYIPVAEKYVPTSSKKFRSIHADLEAKKVAAIAAAVEVVTAGKGHVTRIEKLN